MAEAAPAAPAAPQPLSAPRGLEPEPLAPTVAKSETPAPPEKPKHEESKGPVTISVLPEEYKALHERLAKFEAREAERQIEINKKQEEALRAQAEKAGNQAQFEEFKQAQELRVSELRQQLDKQKNETLAEKLAVTVADALNGIKFGGQDPTATAGLVRRLILDEIESVHDANGKPSVRDKKTFRPAAEYIKDRLQSSDYAVFLAPQTKGGSGTGQAAQTAPPGSPNAQPGSLESIVDEWKNRQNKYQAFGLRPVGK